MSQKIFITGSDGFIGSHLIEYLVHQGFDIRAYAYYNPFNSWGWLDKSPLAKYVELIAGDIRDAHSVHNAMQGCQKVLHLAALNAIPSTFLSPDAYVETNIKGTLNVLQACKDIGIEHIIHTSSCEVYGTAQTKPMNEAHPLWGQSPYAATKAAADHLALSFYHTYGTPVTILRPFTVYGPRQSVRAFLPKVITQIAHGKKEILLPKNTQLRDFISVFDVIHAFAALLEAERSTVLGQTFNCGSGIERNITDVVMQVANIMQENIEIAYDSRTPKHRNDDGDMCLVADAAHLRNSTTWKPHYTTDEGFIEGLTETIAWYKNPSHIQQYKSEMLSIQKENTI